MKKLLINDESFKPENIKFQKRAPRKFKYHKKFDINKIPPILKRMA